MRLFDFILLRICVLVKGKYLRFRVIVALTDSEASNMSDLYKRLYDLCEKRGISGYRMCKDIGIQPSIMTDLKMGRRSSVKAETANKMATYFGVTVGYLLGDTDEKETPPVEQNGGLEDELFAFYGEVKPLFDERDIEDLKIFIKAKADYKRKMLDDKSRKDKTEPDR